LTSTGEGESAKMDKKKRTTKKVLLWGVKKTGETGGENHQVKAKGATGDGKGGIGGATSFNRKCSKTAFEMGVVGTLQGVRETRNQAISCQKGGRGGRAASGELLNGAKTALDSQKKDKYRLWLTRQSGGGKVRPITEKVCGEREAALCDAKEHIQKSFKKGSQGGAKMRQSGTPESQSSHRGGGKERKKSEGGRSVGVRQKLKNQKKKTEGGIHGGFTEKGRLKGHFRFRRKKKRKGQGNPWSARKKKTGNWRELTLYHMLG